MERKQPDASCDAREEYIRRRRTHFDHLASGLKISRKFGAGYQQILHHYTQGHRPVSQVLSGLLDVAPVRLVPPCSFQALVAVDVAVHEAGLAEAIQHVGLFRDESVLQNLRSLVRSYFENVIFQRLPDCAYKLETPVCKYYSKSACPYDFDCMKRITVEEVVQAAGILLEK